jgi:hypothetical protein
MNTYFNWSKVYSVTHAQGSYLIFTAEYGKKNFTGVILPANMDDIWNIAGSRLIDKISNEQPAASDEEVLRNMNNWMAQNLKGKFAIEPMEGMYPPLEVEMEVEMDA